MRNNLNISGLSEFVHEAAGDSKEARIDCGVSLDWISGTRTRVSTKSLKLGRHRVVRSFEFDIDEPSQLLGLNSNPTPQEYLLGALAGCMAVTFVAGASLFGITLEKLRLEIAGEIDLRGFLGIEGPNATGLEKVRYTWHVKGDGTREQYEKLADRVTRHSPNYATFANPVKFESKMVVE